MVSICCRTDIPIKQNVFAVKRNTYSIRGYQFNIKQYYQNFVISKQKFLFFVKTKCYPVFYFRTLISLFLCNISLFRKKKYLDISNFLHLEVIFFAISKFHFIISTYYFVTLTKYFVISKYQSKWNKQSTCYFTFKYPYITTANLCEAVYYLLQEVLEIQQLLITYERPFFSKKLISDKKNLLLYNITKDQNLTEVVFFCLFCFCFFLHFVNQSQLIVRKSIIMASLPRNIKYKR